MLDERMLFYNNWRRRKTVLTRKRVCARMSKIVSEERPQNPEVIHANINMGVDIINETAFLVIECPSCKTVFGLELKVVLKLIKQAMNKTKQNEDRSVGVV